MYFFSFQTGHSALQKAAAEGHLEVVKHLVGRGAAVDHQDEVVSTAKKTNYTAKRKIVFRRLRDLNPAAGGARGRDSRNLPKEIYIAE